MESDVERTKVQIYRVTPKAKAINWAYSDSKVRNVGERDGLDTQVVLLCQLSMLKYCGIILRIKAKALNIAPGK